MPLFALKEDLILSENTPINELAIDFLLRNNPLEIISYGVRQEITNEVGDERMIVSGREEFSGEYFVLNKYGTPIVRIQIEDNFDLGDENIINTIKKLVGNEIILRRVASGASTTGQGITIEQLAISEALRKKTLTEITGKSENELIEYLQKLRLDQIRETRELKRFPERSGIITADDGTKLEMVATLVAIVKAKRAKIDKVVVFAPNPSTSGSDSAKTAMCAGDQANFKCEKGVLVQFEGVNLEYQEVNYKTDIIAEVKKQIETGNIVRLDLVTVTKNGGAIGALETLKDLEIELGDKFLTHLVIELDNCQGRIPTKELAKLVELYPNLILIDTGSKAPGLPMYLGTANFSVEISEDLSQFGEVMVALGFENYSDEVSIDFNINKEHIPEVLRRIFMRNLEIESMKKQNLAQEKLVEKGYQGDITLLATRAINQALRNRASEMQGINLLNGVRNRFMEKVWGLDENDAQNLTSIFMLGIDELTKEQLVDINKAIGKARKGEVAVNLGQPSSRDGQLGLRYGLDWWRISNLIIAAAENKELATTNLADVLKPIVDEIIFCGQKMREKTIALGYIKSEQ